MSDEARRGEADKISYHILPAAGTMVGVCTTLVGLVKITEFKDGPSHVDIFAALAALIFLFSAMSSYLSFRGGRLSKFSAQLERIADTMFIVGLVSITVVSVLFAFELI